MKKICLTLLACLVLGVASAQTTYIKGNALYWAVAAPNIGAEVKLGNHWTLNVDANFSAWKSINGKPYMIQQVIPEIRYYIKEANRGFYAAGYGGVHFFKMSKWNYTHEKFQVGRGISLGVSLGYELPIADRWLMDFFVGGGWQLSRYRGFVKPQGIMYIDWNGSGEWIPYKVGVSFAYRVTRNRK